MIGTIPWDVNYIAVVVSTVVGMIIGAVYSLRGRWEPRG